MAEDRDNNRMRPDPASCHPGGCLFEIRIKGQLDSRWSEWLGNLEVKQVENGETILLGPIPDQAALMGILNKLSRLNLSLRSVNEVKSIPIVSRRPNEQHPNSK